MNTGGRGGGRGGGKGGGEERERERERDEPVFCCCGCLSSLLTNHKIPHTVMQTYTNVILLFQTHTHVHTITYVLLCIVQYT